ncbi:glycerophosphodiester phosphodiesterase family protein [Allorhizobium sp. BGMRC 0089]|uniref:glycerophosphodiester phosphodiesterase family protein n=1 Tax=Allorhizobium sonneratiae TaxID=2934936 RepID=UPI002034496B|nr:glycerophosphodiester phosphodiesterase family protein [Allorhizobium sonneratiae]MCM2293908.1 glycerophosphodiester phosphodiesterase family protein [Allorhizobium sonneratiae]
MTRLSASAAFAAAKPCLYSRIHDTVLTVAHRGVWDHAPENSIAALEAAIKAGIEIVEIDTQSTDDGVLVVMHDETIDRTTTGQGDVSALESGYIRSQFLKNAAGGPQAGVSGERVPLLQDVLEAARGRVLINIDTKYERDLAAVARLVMDMNMAEGVIMKTVVDPDADIHLAETLGLIGTIPHMPIMHARPGRFAEDLRRIERLNAPMIETKFTHLDDLIAARSELERQDIRLWINTLDVSFNMDLNDSRAMGDPDAVWGTLIDAGAGAIQTDCGPLFRHWLNRSRTGSESD